MDSRTLFYQGRYSEVISQAKKHETVPRIGALAFTGRVAEARAIFETGVLSPTEKLEAGFYLALAWLRQSELSLARRQLLENLRQARSEDDARGRFFALQGIAFYRYFFGQFATAARLAQASLAQALADSFLYGEVLAHDLLGHSLLQIGRVSEGLRELELAHGKTDRLGNGGIEAAIRISSLIYRSEYGHLKNARNEIGRALSRIEPEDTYSRVDLILELGRILTWEGAFDEAESVLREAWRLIHSNRNFRQELMACVRLGYLAYLRGETETSAVFLESGKAAAKKIFDRSLVARIHALERKTEGAPGRSETTKPNRPGEDLIRDWIRASRGMSDDRFVEECVKTGAYSRLIEEKRVPRGQACLAIDEANGRAFLSIRSGVRVLAHSLTPLQTRLLYALGSETPVSKETLVRTVWEYGYHPLRHDPLVYQAINGLRKILGTEGYLLQTHPRGYRIASRILRLARPKKPEARIAVTKTLPDVPFARSSGIDPRLNFRQARILEMFKQTPVIDVRSCRKALEASEITFSRDLRFMAGLGLIRRIGKGRATQYILNGL